MAKQGAAAAQNYLPEVRNQYEALPYPPRNPEEERERLFCTHTDALDQVSYFCFGGKEDFTDARILCAGDGTGDASIYMAEQLKARGNPHSIIALDISEASQSIARQRAAIRKLDNIEWVNASVYDVAKLDLGEFDYISCSGMLHHLDDPSRGLKALRKVLKDTGAMGIMVYGQYGRTGIYQVQEIMRRVCRADDNADTRVALCEAFLKNVPKSNWMNHNAAMYNTDINTFGAPGIYDLFLHSQDRAYTVPQLIDWLKQCKLELLDFLQGRSEYNPMTYTGDPEWRKRIAEMERNERYALGEIMNGAINRHIFYAAKEMRLAADINDPQMNICFSSMLPKDIFHQICDQLEALPVGQNLQATLKTIRWKLVIQRFEYSAHLMRAINDERNLDEVVEAARISAGLEKTEDNLKTLRHQFQHLLFNITAYDSIVLRHKSVAPYVNIIELSNQSKSR